MAPLLRAQTAFAEGWSVLSLLCGSVGRGNKTQVIRPAQQVPVALSHLVGPLAYMCLMSLSMGVRAQV